MKKLFTFLLFLFPLIALQAEDGSRLWLRMAEVMTPAVVHCAKSDATIALAIKELQTYWKGGEVTLMPTNNKETRALKNGGYLIAGNMKTGITLSSATSEGLLYAAYHLLRLQETGFTGTIQLSEAPAYDIRILNHWDNLDRSVERGYAGRSLWEWESLPETISPRYEAYARANASIGINATVLNNVNASPQILSAAYLLKVKALADIFRPYGIKTYLAINFSSPKELGGLPASDPFDKEVQKWWKAKAAEIYRLIPDFGGFLVKANSEGLPGPQDYGRTHVDGANMIADALKPYKGVVMWRAFVYDPAEPDRAKQAYQEFMPFDGKFRENVIVQVKNGPVDFQPREPFSPLFGAMKKTPVMVEFQITQEYLGFSNHMAYLASMWRECLDSDTYQQGEGSTVARATDGTMYKQPYTAIAGVANTGTDVSWCGHHLAQANWYAFGRLAWNHRLSSQEILDEWIPLTFKDSAEDDGNHEFTAFQHTLSDMMLASCEAVVDYMMPLGLHHLFAWSHHYGPEPWCDIPGARADWMPAYYHRADGEGLGFDRSSTGSNAVVQYQSPLREQYGQLETCPEELLLWFHHVPWTHRMKSGHTLWNELCFIYHRGVQKTRVFQQQWDALQGRIDDQRFGEIQDKLKTQARDAVWWKDACLLYFQTFSGMNIPDEVERPVHRLERLKQFRLDIDNHRNATEELLFMK